MSDLKPIKIYGHGPTPNPFKVKIILEELNIPYCQLDTSFDDIKKEPFISINPNGRLPAIEDPNTGVQLWESGAIIEYLIEQYDKNNSFNYAVPPEKYQQSAWKHFQMSGQGPYFGQLGWFKLFHPEKNITSAIDRYKGEIRRILGVIDAHLTKTGQPYLVGEKISYVDLMFVPWNWVAAGHMMGGEEFYKEWKETWPKCYEWHQSMMARDSVKKSLPQVAEKTE